MDLEKFILVFNLIYVVLISREIKWGWLFGIAGSGLFVVSNIEQNLYMDAFLNFYYVLVGIYGVMAWNAPDKSLEINISSLPNLKLLKLLLVTLCLALSLGYLFSKYTNNALPYLDATITLLSFLATWMTTRKYLENWLLWIVADGLAIYLFYQKQTPEYIILYVVYTLMATYGFWNWNKKMNIKK